MDQQKQQFIRTRIAPTPSGFLHLGNVLSFALTAAIAEKTNAKILLRIDDLDRDRVKKQYVQDIFDTLNFLEIPWHGGPRNYQEYEREYSQLHRLALYQKALHQLEDGGSVFACTCSRAQVRRNNPDDVYPGTCRDKALPLDTNETAWRLRAEAGKEIIVGTLYDGVIATNLPANMQDFIVRKKDGYPAYQLASVVDDLHFGVDLVVRGEDLWASTLAQIELASAMKTEEFQKIAFHHHPLLIESPGKKLSKSAGDTSIRYLRGQGKKPPDIYLAIAGMLGFKETASNWQQLATLVEAK